MLDGSSTTCNSEVMTSRQRLDNMPSSSKIDGIISASMENAVDLGYDEQADEDSFYAAVLGMVLAELDS